MFDKDMKQTAPVIMVGSGVICTAVSAGSILLKNNYDWGYGFFFIALFSILLALGAMKRTTVSTEIAIAYLARLGMCILCTVQNDGDADNYAVNAINYAAMPLGEVFLNVPMGAYLYSWVISFFFRFFGPCYTPVRAMNMAISVCCVYVTIDIVSEIYHNTKITKQAAIWMAVFPNLIRFSSYFANREPMLMIFMLLYLKYSYRYYKSNHIQNLILSVIFLIPAMILHTSMLAMIALTMFIVLTRETKTSDKASANIGKALLALAMVLLFVYMLMSGVGTEKFGIGGGVELSVSGVSSLGNMSAAGRAAYLKGVSFSNPILTILFLPIRMLYFLYTPFVWMLRAAVDLVGFFDAALYIYVSYRMYKKIKLLHNKAKKTSEEKFVMLLFFVLAVVVAMFAAVTSNYGTAIRHRCKLFPLMLLIVADKISKRDFDIKEDKDEN